MQKFSKILVGIVALAAIVGIGVLIGSLGGSKPRPATTVETPPAVEPAPKKPRTTEAVTTAHSNVGVPRIIATAPEVANVNATSSMTNWEERLEEIIGAETDDTNKVNQLFELFPNAPDDAKPEIAQHLSNLVADDNYSRLGELLKDPSLPEPALDILLSDALNRPNSIKLPELLGVAKTPNHSKAEEAKDILSLFLDEDYGQDWSKWQEKMAAWLRDNPD